MKVTELKWYVIRVISGKERKIVQAIETDLENSNLSNAVKQILIPMEKVIQLKKGKKITKERNFYPGYILIEAYIESELIHLIKNINGVIGFLGSKDDPVPLRQHEVNRILGKVDAMNEEGDTLEVPFISGEPVKVIDGPFNGFSGVVEEINEEKKKLRVIVKIFGRKTPVELNYMQVEKE